MIISFSIEIAREKLYYVVNKFRIILADKHTLKNRFVFKKGGAVFSLLAIFFHSIN